MKSAAPDFHRNVHCLLGLPFDAVTLQEAVARIRTAIDTRTPCFVSTPNLNFLMAAQNNTNFRDSVIHSDMSLADGMPVVWLARLMGIPVPERVAGSDVFDALRNASGYKPIKVYFFGGPPGIAEQAAARINAERKGMECVGFESPGYGSVQDMSSAETLDKINRSGADFLVVSLGAAKGQAWIEHNQAALNVPVVSHLGAVVNFVVGNVQRAPRWMQKTGLEWLWRIKEEPKLWRRYFNDGKALLKLFLTRIPSGLVYRWRFKAHPVAGQAPAFRWVESDDARLIQLFGRCTQECLPAFRSACARWLELENTHTLDVSNVLYIDHAFLGTLLMLLAHAQKRGKPLQLVAEQRTNKHRLHICGELGLSSAATTLSTN